MRRVYVKGEILRFFFTGACVYKTVGGISRPVFHDCEECEACNLLKGYQCYGEICCPYHQENFLFHTENETTRFVRNIGSYIPDHTKLLFRRPYS